MNRREQRAEYIRLFNEVSQYPNFMTREIITFSFERIPDQVKMTGRELLNIIKNLND